MTQKTNPAAPCAANAQARLEAPLEHGTQGVPVVHRLRIASSIWNRLQAHHLAPGKATEAISLALGHMHRGPAGEVTIVLARDEGLMLFADDCYERRSYGAAVLRRDVRAQALWRAVSEGWTAVVDIHDHHFAQQAHFSVVDDRDDLATAHYFATTLPRHADTLPLAAALLLARDDARARFVGGAQTPSWGTPLRVDVVGLNGLRARGLGVGAPSVEAMAERVLRQAAIVPAAVQARLAQTQVAVVGCGGTGSIAAEALARLGVERLTLVDADRVEVHNLNRLQACGVDDLGRPKAEVLASQLARLLPGVQVDAVCSTVHEGRGRERLAQADVIIGCLDNAETRWWLNCHAVQHLQPYFDVGVVVEPDDDMRMLSRVNVVVPGVGPCGHCSPVEFFPRERPAVFLDAHTLRMQRRAGYLLGSAARKGSQGGDPALYGLNLHAVGALMQEFVHWACGRPVAHALVQSLAQPLLQRLPLQDFGGQVASDCPVCGMLLGAAGSRALPEVTSDGAEEAISSGRALHEALTATFEAMLSR